MVIVHAIKAARTMMGYFDTSESRSKSGQRSLLQSQALLISLLVVLFLVNLLGRFPGEHDPDAVDQYRQVVTNHFDDFHPPIMAWVWSYLRLLLGDGFGPIYTFHIVLYWFGFGIVALALMRSGRILTAWGILCVSMFPLFLMQNINVDKDVGVAVSFLAAFGVALWFRVKDKKIPLLAGALVTGLLLYGTLVRTNAVFAVVPLVAYLVYRRAFAKPLRLLVTTVPIALLLVPASTVFNRTILEAQATNQMSMLQVYDLAGIAYYSHDLSIFGPDNSFTDAEVRGCYSPVIHDVLFPAWGGKCGFFWDRLVAPYRLKGHNEFEPDQAYKTPIDDRPLATLWVAAIGKHPIAYLQHRLAHFNSELFFWVPAHHADPPVTAALVRGGDVHALGQTPIKRMMDILRNNVFTTPAFWVVVDIWLFVMWSNIKTHCDYWQRQAALALTCSALLYTGAYFIIGIATDPRYTLWSLMATFVALVISLTELIPRFKSPGRLELTCAGTILVTIVLIAVARAVCGDALYPNV
jgi:hypothetical protein